MFLLKKIVAPLAMPMSLCLGALIIGLLFLFLTRRKNLGRWVVALGVLMLIMFSYDFVPNILMRPLENQYPPLMDTGSARGTHYIVVLGAGHDSDVRMPANSQLGQTSVVRLVEAIRLHRLLPGSRLVLSGAGVFDPVPNARLMAQTAMELGIDKDDLLLIETARDTKDEARLIKRVVGSAPFILVTTASHMPRALRLFENQGTRPIPAPTDFRVRAQHGIRPSDFFPSPQRMETAQYALHEYLGILWARFRGQL